jgi:hypothetical protein
MLLMVEGQRWQIRRAEIEVSESGQERIVYAPVLKTKLGDMGSVAPATEAGEMPDPEAEGGMTHDDNPRADVVSWEPPSTRS